MNLNELKVIFSANRFGTAQLTLLITLIIGFFSLIIANINSGYELGDHGFYLLHIRQPEEITHTLTHFGLVWNFLIGDQGIVANRLVNILLITLAVVTVVLAAPIAMSRQIGIRQIITGIAIALAVSSTYFSSFILDPSYNGIALFLVCFGVTLASVSVELAQRKRRGLALFIAGVIGALIAALVFTKASTAVSFSVFILIVAGSVSFVFRSGFLFFGLLMAGVCGFGIFLVLFQLFTGMVPQIVAAFSNGLRVYSSGGSHSIGLLGIEALERIYYFIRSCAAALLRGGWMIALPVLAALLTCTPLMQQLNIRTRFRIVVLAVAAILVVALLFVILDASSTSVRYQMITVFTLGGMISLGFWPTLRLTPSAHVLIAGAVLLPFLTIFGTANSYIAQILHVGAGLSLLPAWIVLSVASVDAAAPARRIILALAAFAVILSTHSASNDPYRIGGSLAMAKETIVFLGDEVLNVTPPVAAFASDLQPHAHPQGEKDSAPTVFDLTGQLPIAVLLLNGRAAGAAWFLDSFGPSFSTAVFSDLDDSDFLNGWVLVRQNVGGGVDESAPHFKTFVDRLEGLETSFEERFQPVATLTAPNWGKADEIFTLVLYKPSLQRPPATSSPSD